MSGTLTVPVAALEALERGEEQLRRWLQLLETGTDEQIEAELCWRGAMVRADAEVHRALFPAIDPRSFFAGTGGRLDVKEYYEQKLKET